MTATLPPPVRVQVDSACTAMQAERIDRVKAYHAGCLKSFGSQMGYAYLAGAELLALKSETPRGQFEDLKETQFGDISRSALGRYMQLAEAIQAKYPTVGYLRPTRLLSNGEFDGQEQQKVLKAVHEVADGKTLTQLYRDLGVIRDTKDTGRKPGEKPKRLTLAEQAALRIQQATEDWAELDQAHTVYADKFIVLTDDQVTAQIATLEQALKARKTWLKQPSHARDPKPIAAFFS